MSAGLDQILAATRQRVAKTRHAADLRELERRAERHSPRGFRRRLQEASAAGVAIIAELKKASPSRGTIRDQLDAGALAPQLARAGAAALSVLTEEEFFQGSLENLRQASAACPLPCLRKDFIVDEYQVLESRAHCADAVLLIVAALRDAELRRLLGKARELGLDALCEVHDEQELARAKAADCDLIGVNSRDLRTFRVELETALRLASELPPHAVRVAESGIHSGSDIRRLQEAGYQAFLVGESLMKATDPAGALSHLIADAKVKVVSSL